MNTDQHTSIAKRAGWRRLMVNYREYWNPQAFMAAMAGARF